jgi:hypothetical protein
VVAAARGVCDRLRDAVRRQCQAGVKWIRDLGSTRLEYRNGTMVLTRNDFAALTCSCVAYLPATALRFTAGDR